MKFISFIKATRNLPEPFSSPEIEAALDQAWGARRAIEKLSDTLEKAGLHVGRGFECQVVDETRTDLSGSAYKPKTLSEVFYEAVADFKRSGNSRIQEAFLFYPKQPATQLPRIAEQSWKVIPLRDEIARLADAIKQCPLTNDPKRNARQLAAFHSAMAMFEDETVKTAFTNLHEVNTLLANKQQAEDQRSQEAAKRMADRVLAEIAHRKKQTKRNWGDLKESLGLTPRGDKSGSPPGRG